ncbi:MAG TPA: hypothetical protein PKO16_08355 [Bacteroidia bacterium]|nr:hypothetical protein [Bacteroidia bacterium]
MSKKTIAAILFQTVILSFAFSQDFLKRDTLPKPAKEPFLSWDRVYIGGGLGLQFGNITLVNISPDIGYRITKRYSAGVGLRYIYFSDKYYNYTQNIYGGSVFNRFNITDFLFAHAEYEVLNGEWTRHFPRYNLINIWVGGGLQQSMGNSSFNVMALWNLNESIDNPFPNPQIRVGINVGL